MTVSICIIRKGDKYVLQRRGANPKIGAAGLIGAFGGKVEKDETPLGAICREIAEETSLTPTEENLEFLGKYQVISDHNLEQVRVQIHAYAYDIDDDEPVAANEGEIVVFTYEQAIGSLSEMTPGTRKCFEAIIRKEPA